MYCTYCRAVRNNKAVPCPRCGAPAEETPTTTSAWETELPQFEFGSTGSQWPQPPDAMQQPQNALLPVPYQPQVGSSLQTLPVPLEPEIAHPPQSDQARTYIPPMYTSARTPTPLHRTISALISVLIVALLVCSGASYFLKTSGMLHQVRLLYTGTTPPPIKPTAQVHLADPQTAPIKGPAYTVIPSATTTSHLNGNIAVTKEQVFQPGQVFYVAFGVQNPPTTGTVTFKWYMNGLYFKPSPPVMVKEKQVLQNGTSSMIYDVPAEGKVEIYWNGQLAQALFFVVR